MDAREARGTMKRWWLVKGCDGKSGDVCGNSGDGRSMTWPKSQLVTVKCLGVARALAKTFLSSGYYQSMVATTAKGLSRNSGYNANISGTSAQP